MSLTEKSPPLAPDRAQLEKINRFTRRELKPEEVYVFSLILCDNEIDRDCERFSAASLEKLAALFIGKTGVFDHSPTAKNQSARIFDANLEKTGDPASDGEPYCRVRAWAYMLRSEKNADLIAEIEGGIKKEVSVGCAVERVICSICGADQKASPCSHQKGESYGGELCHHLLENPTDAYEWSFVAVPSQKKAGVTKRAAAGANAVTQLEKLFESDGDIILSKAELALLRAQYKALAARADAGSKRLRELRREVVKLAGLAELGLSAALLEKMAEGLDPAGLDELHCCLLRLAKKSFPLSPQLAAGRKDRARDESAFCI